MPGPKKNDCAMAAISSWRGHRVGDGARIGSRGRKTLVRERERPAALVPGVARHRADGLRTAGDERARRKNLSAGVAVAARGPTDLRKRHGVAGRIGERRRYGS